MSNDSKTLVWSQGIYIKQRFFQAPGVVCPSRRLGLSLRRSMTHLLWGRQDENSPISSTIKTAFFYLLSSSVLFEPHLYACTYYLPGEQQITSFTLTLGSVTTVTDERNPVGNVTIFIFCSLIVCLSTYFIHEEISLSLARLLACSRFLNSSLLAYNLFYNVGFDWDKFGPGNDSLLLIIQHGRRWERCVTRYDPLHKKRIPRCGERSTRLI